MTKLILQGNNERYLQWSQTLQLSNDTYTYLFNYDIEDTCTCISIVYY